MDTERPADTGGPLRVPSALRPVAEEARGCRNCPLWQPATQTVFGEGPPDPSLVLVGEQPGDREDIAGRPFVGPAGRLLADALVEAGIDRKAVYVTNAVKHFKFEQRGKRRIHAKAGNHRDRRLQTVARPGTGGPSAARARAPRRHRRPVRAGKGRRSRASGAG